MKILSQVMLAGLLFVGMHTVHAAVEIDLGKATQALQTLQDIRDRLKQFRSAASKGLFKIDDALTKLDAFVKKAQEKEFPGASDAAAYLQTITDVVRFIESYELPFLGHLVEQPAVEQPKEA